MKIENTGLALHVSDIPEIHAVNAATFRDQIRAELSDGCALVEIDLSQTRFVDESGLGALFAINRMARMKNRTMTMRLVNLRPGVQELFELVKMHNLFEIVRR